MSHRRNLRLFLVGWSISFLGALSIGTLNTTVASYTLQGRFLDGFEFGIAAILVEVIVVRLALTLIEKLAHLQKLFLALSILMCAGIFFLAYLTLSAAYHMTDFVDVLPFAGMHAFYSGLVLSLLNPLHLPFWMSWSAVLRGRGLLQANNTSYNIYIGAIGSGTAVAFSIYAIAGNFLMETLKAKHHLINWILGGTFLLTGMVIAFKLITKKLNLKGVVSP
ncbi:LysE family translocator [Mucilaginibacter sp.]|uniref:LysE family translocator n=1 Tax=Mucilaginibacter sp. TaxID=1882438 RepID=UPI00356347AE